MIQLKNIYKSFGSVNVLKDVSLQANAGEIICITGASGAGKTTLLQILGTIDKPDSGKCQVFGIDTLGLNEKKLAAFRNKEIGFVFQFHHLLPEFTAIENVMLPALIGGDRKKNAEKKAAELLDFLGLQHRHTHKPSELSAGEQQRVAVARALVMDARLILADEPSGNLDSKNAEELHQLFFRLRDEFGKTFVIVTHSEKLAIDRAKKLFGAEYANVQPHSGAQANMAVFLTCIKPGDVFMGLDLAHGGHLSHGSPVNSSGILYKPVAYQVEEETGVINYDKMEEVALRERPKMIIGGASAYSRDWDWKRMRAIADKIGAILMGDISHPAGLIAKGLLNNPLDYCHICTTTTHKTLRGPRGGLILMGKDFQNPWDLKTPKGEIKMMSQLLDSAVFPGIQGGPLEHVIAAKAVAFGECLSDTYLEYIKQVKLNAAAMCKAFMDKGYKVISNGTDNHLMLIDLRTKFPEISGKLVENTLVKADITINKNMVPFDSRTPFTTSGIRVGTPAVTTRGLKEADMSKIVDLIDEVISNIDNEAVIESVRKRVNEMMGHRPLFAW